MIFDKQTEAVLTEMIFDWFIKLTHDINDYTMLFLGIMHKSGCGVY